MRSAILWLLGCFLVTLFCGLVFTSAQQVLRLSANDPQIQIAQDVANSLSSGKKATDVVPKEKINASQSLSPFVIIFDKSGKIVESNVAIQNGASAPPQGVFNFDEDYTTKDLINLRKDLERETEGKINEKTFTWQPASGVRLASVLVKYENGFVLVGRSLREVEIRTQRLFDMVFAAWILGISAVTFIVLIFSISKRNKK